LISYNKEYLIDFRKKSIEFRIKNKFVKRKQIWLINDRKDQAGDNGEYFFRYLKKIKPKEIIFYFVLDKNCPDFERLKNFENVIDFNSSQYLNKFLETDKIISSVSEPWVDNAFGIDGKYMINLYIFEYIYLKNGIIKDDLSWHLNKKKKNFDLIITSSKREYNSLLNINYGYEKNNLALTGLPRFDNLIEIHNRIQCEKIIIIYPTWRSYIKGTRDLITLKSIESESFINTNYFNFYNNLINNQQILDVMIQNDYTGIFCLHPNFASQYRYFNENNRFKIKKQCNKQDLFAKASLLITDYSSIFFDFGYLQKPIIYTQFD
jgi:CDP-glycerol glycerophosphotransferase (TagB/SpsB family)